MSGVAPGLPRRLAVHLLFICPTQLRWSRTPSDHPFRVIYRKRARTTLARTRTQPFRTEAAEEERKQGHGTCPAGLVTGADSGAVVAAEVLMEQHQVAPVRIGLQDRQPAVYGTMAVGIPEERAGEPVTDLPGHLVQGDLPSREGRALHRETIAEENMQVQQCADQHHVDGEPHRPAPVGVPAGHTGVRPCGAVADAVFSAADFDNVRVRSMPAGYRTYTVRPGEFFLIQHPGQVPAQPS